MSSPRLWWDARPGFENYGGGVGNLRRSGHLGSIRFWVAG